MRLQPQKEGIDRRTPTITSSSMQQTNTKTLYGELYHFLPPPPGNVNMYSYMYSCIYSYTDFDFGETLINMKTNISNKHKKSRK